MPVKIFLHRTNHLEDLLARFPFGTPPDGLWDCQGNRWLIIDVDGTKQAARQRALPATPDLPPAHRRFDQVCAPGHLGQKRGEVVRGKAYHLLEQPVVHERLRRPPDQHTIHPESGMHRALYDCAEIALTPTGPVVRMLLATHPARSSPPPIGKVKEEYQLLLSSLTVSK